MDSFSVSTTAPTATPTSPSTQNVSTNNTDEPKRFIYSPADMTHFMNSPVKRDLLSFVTTLGRSTIQSQPYIFDTSNPLIGLSPGMASLHGSLSYIASHWLTELPPDKTVHARFGNPMFKEWHQRLVQRSRGIIQSIMDCHIQYVVNRQSDTNKKEEQDDVKQQPNWDIDILEKCSEAGQMAAKGILNDGNTTSNSNTSSDQQEKVIIELQSHLHQGFGHEIRLDYGTGHECSFYIFLYTLCKIGIFGNIPKTTTPSIHIMAPVALSITNQYLEVCRGLQTEYMLEPAGSHGVWGLDDYHCIPFYIGACQLQHSYYVETVLEYSKPSCIHDQSLMNSTESESILYLTCIKYIKSLKKGVPFFESSPMLNDISQLSNWGKVSGGLLRLFEGEVLNKKPVVQHFMFGNIFKGKHRL